MRRLRMVARNSGSSGRADGRSAKTSDAAGRLSRTRVILPFGAAAASVDRRPSPRVPSLTITVTTPSGARQIGESLPNVVVTGGSGFLGARLARQLLGAGELAVTGSASGALGRLTLIDRVPPPADIAADDRVSVVTGDLDDLLGPGGQGSGADAGPAVLADADVIFHLAAAVSAECEADFDLGMRSNLGATERLLESCRALRTRPAVVFASSVAAFGASEDQPLPAVVDDHTMPNPQSSYGIQKVVGEHLIADYTRKGYLRGRTVRLMTVVVRPGRPNAAASGFLSAIIREPLRGERTACPVDPETAVALASPARAIEGLLCAATSSDQAWGGRTPVNLPALTVTVGEMVSALERADGRDAVELIDWDPDPAVARIVTSWPARFRTDRASRLGLSPDTDFDAVIAMHLAESGL